MISNDFATWLSLPRYGLSEIMLFLFSSAANLPGSKQEPRALQKEPASHPHPIHTHLPWHSPAFPQSFTSLPFTHFALVSRLKAYALRYMNSLPLFVMLSLGAHMALNLTSYSPLLKCHFLWLQHLKLLSYPSCTSRSVFFHCTYHLLIYYITRFVYCLSPPVEHKLHKRKTFYFAQGKTPHRCLVSK